LCLTGICLIISNLMIKRIIKVTLIITNVNTIIFILILMIIHYSHSSSRLIWHMHIRIISVVLLR
jgi:hypothetical protein